jgi:hypothetical protein
MYTKRLITLARHLRTIAGEPSTKRGFNLETWFNDINNRAIDFQGKTCGTTACAFGEATFIPEFKRLGLRLRDKIVPTFKGKDGFDAAGKFFGISLYDAERLFDPTSYARLDRTPAKVADRIAALVTGAEI